MRKMIKTTALLLGLMATTLAPTASNAAPTIGADVVVLADGNVIAEFLSNDASFDDELRLSAPPVFAGVIFHNHLNSIGDTVDLGFFTAGTILTFQLDVLTTGLTFFSGPAANNFDGVAHAAVEVLGSTTIVGFEDIVLGGDLDYNDLRFSFTNTRCDNCNPVPEPATMVLLGTGLVGLVGYGWRRRK